MTCALYFKSYHVIDAALKKIKSYVIGLETQWLIFVTSYTKFGSVPHRKLQYFRASEALENNIQFV